MIQKHEWTQRVCYRMAHQQVDGKAHFIDSYREIHPDVKKYPCLTWSTMAKNELQYRIDFIYYKGKDIKAIQSEMIDKHPVRYPSDHAAVVTTFNLK